MACINSLSDVVCNSDLLDVCDDISSRIEQVRAEGLIDLGDDDLLSAYLVWFYKKYGCVVECLLRDATRLQYYVVMA